MPVRLPRDGTPAIAVGRGDGTIELRTLEVGQNPFRRGDMLVTSGIGGIFPPDVPVARVIRIEGDTAIARPVADPARIDFAIVQRAYQPAATGTLDDAARAGRRRRPSPAPPPAPRPPAEQPALPARAPAAAAARPRPPPCRRRGRRDEPDRRLQHRGRDPRFPAALGAVPLDRSLAILLALFPIVMPSPLLPDFGFLIV